MRLGLVQNLAALDGTNGGQILLICASAIMAFSVIKTIKFDVNDNLVVLQPDSSQLFSQNDIITNFEVAQVPLLFSLS